MSMSNDTKLNRPVAVPGADDRSGDGPWCLNCGYSLNALNAETCPECGAAIAELKLGAALATISPDRRRSMRGAFWMLAWGTGITALMICPWTARLWPHLFFRLPFVSLTAATVLHAVSALLLITAPLTLSIRERRQPVKESSPWLRRVTLMVTLLALLTYCPTLIRELLGFGGSPFHVSWDVVVYWSVPQCLIALADIGALHMLSRIMIRHGMRYIGIAVANGMAVIFLVTVAAISNFATSAGPDSWSTWLMTTGDTYLFCITFVAAEALWPGFRATRHAPRL